MPVPTRPIELYRIWEGDNHVWDTVFVDIPATTHDEKVEEVARKVAFDTHGAGYSYAMYNSMDDEVPEVPGAFVIEVQDNARCVQRFLVTGCADEEEALQKMGEGDREQYGPDETLAWLGAGDDDYSVKAYG